MELKSLKVTNEVIISGETFKVDQNLEVLCKRGSLFKKNEWIDLGSAMLLSYPNGVITLGIISDFDNLLEFTIHGEYLDRWFTLSSLLPPKRGPYTPEVVDNLLFTLYSAEKTEAFNASVLKVNTKKNTPKKVPSLPERINIGPNSRYNDDVSVELSLRDMLDKGKEIAVLKYVQPYTTLLVNFKKDRKGLSSNTTYIAIFLINANRDTINFYNTNGELIHYMYDIEELDNDYSKHDENRKKFFINILQYLDVVVDLKDYREKVNTGTVETTYEILIPILKPLKLTDKIPLESGSHYHPSKLTFSLNVDFKEMMRNSALLSESCIAEPDVLFMVNVKDSYDTPIPKDSTYIAVCQAYPMGMSFNLYTFNGEKVQQFNASLTITSTRCDHHLRTDEGSYDSREEFYQDLIRKFPIVTGINNIKGYDVSSFTK